MRAIYNKLKPQLLKLLKVPEEPTPPAGVPESIRIFRAAPAYFRLKLVGWALATLAQIVGVVIFLIMLRIPDATEPFRNVLAVIEIIGVTLVVLQMPFSLFLVWLDYEMRWYIVTDRSLRIRHGIWRMREMTMTFANVQQINIQRGPIQQLFGIADLRVRSAGGGGMDMGNQAGHGPAGEMMDSMHVAVFRGVDNPEEIRDLMLARLRRLRDSGLGNPEEEDDAEDSEATPPPLESPLLVAAREALVEAKRLREAAAVG